MVVDVDGKSGQVLEADSNLPISHLSKSNGHKYDASLALDTPLEPKRIVSTFSQFVDRGVAVDWQVSRLTSS